MDVHILHMQKNIEICWPALKVTFVQLHENRETEVALCQTSTGHEEGGSWSIRWFEHQKSTDALLWVSLQTGESLFMASLEEHQRLS